MEKTRIIGYHGTTLKNVERIMDEQRFVDSSKDNEWLGKGVYFFAYLNHAKWWVSVGRLKNIEAGILRATLEYSEEQLLDLDDPAQLERVEEAIKELIRSANDSNDDIGQVDLEGLTEKQKWNFVCNAFRQICPEIGITIYTFMANRRFETIGYQQTQRQICVSDHSIICGIERV